MNVRTIPKTLILVFFLMIFAQCVYADSLSLDAYLHKVWSGNVSLRAESYRQSISETEVRAKKGIYDPVVDMSLSQQGSQQSTGLSAGRSAELGSSLKVSQKLETGADLTLSAGSSKADSGTNPYENQLSAQISQPLWSKFGKSVTEYPINQALLDQQVTEQGYKEYVNETLYNAITLFCDYYLNIKNREVLNKKLSYNRYLVDLNKKKQQLKLVTAYDVMEAEIEYKKTEDEILALNGTIANQKAELLQYMGADAVSSRNTELAPLEPAMLPAKDIARINSTLENSPAMLQQVLALKKNKLSIDYYANQILPTTYLDAGLSYGRDADTFTRSLALSDSSYSVGLRLSYPLGNSQAEAALQQEQLTGAQQQLTITNSRQNLQLQALSLHTDLETTGQRIATAKDVMDLSEQFLTGETKKYELGLLTLDKIINDETDLKNAQLNYYEQKVKYIKTYYQLESLQGTIPELFKLSPKETQ